MTEQATGTEQIAKSMAEMRTRAQEITLTMSQQAKAANLILEAGVAYANLVDVEPTTLAARNAGMRRVDPSAPDNSFLIFKLTQPNSTTFGSRMPLGGTPLSQAEIDSIREWILGGAQP